MAKRKAYRERVPKSIKYNVNRDRALYLQRLKATLSRESGRVVTYQEVFDHLVDIMKDSSQ